MLLLLLLLMPTPPPSPPMLLLLLLLLLLWSLLMALRPVPAATNVPKAVVGALCHFAALCMTGHCMDLARKCRSQRDDSRIDRYKRRNFVLID